MLVERVVFRGYLAAVVAIYSALLIFPAEAQEKTTSQKFLGAGNATFSFASADGAIRLICELPSIPKENATFFIAFRAHNEIGSAILPFAAHGEGSTVF